MANTGVAIDVDRAVAILVDPDPDNQVGAVRLCDVHAARLTLPTGWTVDDRRSEAGTGLAGLFGSRPTGTDLPTPSGPLLRRAFGNSANG